MKNDEHIILYVDDEPINLMLFDNMFKRHYRILTADSGRKGLDLLKNNSVRVVFSDMKMPGMNGIEFIEKAKAIFPDIVFFILTGFNITQEIKSALDRKLIHNYFQKPFNSVEIEKAIENTIGN